MPRGKLVRSNRVDGGRVRIGIGFDPVQKLRARKQRAENLLERALVGLAELPSALVHALIGVQLFRSERPAKHAEPRGADDAAHAREVVCRRAGHDAVSASPEPRTRLRRATGRLEVALVLELVDAQHLGDVVEAVIFTATPEVGGGRELGAEHVLNRGVVFDPVQPMHGLAPGVDTLDARGPPGPPGRRPSGPTPGSPPAGSMILPSQASTPKLSVRAATDPRTFPARLFLAITVLKSARNRGPLWDSLRPIAFS